uniref:Uncharacterized protein n=1 Tax=Anguilla anguilla TaxID=7936 RepID=A0A0E9PN49_ANGAN
MVIVTIFKIEKKVTPNHPPELSLSKILPRRCPNVIHTLH